MSSPRSQVDPRLEELIAALSGASGSVELYDAGWRLAWFSDEVKEALEEFGEDRLGYGKHMFEAVCLNPLWLAKLDPESYFELALHWTPIMIGDTPGGKATLLEIARRVLPSWDPPLQLADEDLAALIEAFEPVTPPPIFFTRFKFIASERLPGEVECFVIRLHDAAGEHFGFAILHNVALPASLVSMLTRGDRTTLERTARLVEPGPRHAAILFADLQSSAELSRRLPTGTYFRLISGMTTAMDEIVGRYGGVIGKHAGDGVSAFFLADDLGSESAAAQGAIAAGREMRAAAVTVAKEMSEAAINGDDFAVNVGVHWGGTLYMGQLVTGGRLEVTALGDQVNECARIQQCARDGDALASKALIEHLSQGDAFSLGLDLEGLRYLTLSEVPGVTDKARRDAGGIPVTVL